jgi:hypothetical protein
MSRSYPSGAPLAQVNSSLKCTVAASVLVVRERHAARRSESIAVDRRRQQGLTEEKESVSQYASHVSTLYADHKSTQPLLVSGSCMQHADTGTP